MKFPLTLITFFLLFAPAKLYPQRTPVPSPQNPQASVKEYDQNAWREFKSRDGGFSVSFPGQPKPEVQTVQMAFGPTTVHFFTLGTKTAFYLVSYADFPTAPSTPEQMKAVLDSGRNEQLRNGGTLLNETDVQFNNLVGREVLIAKGERIKLVRMFFVRRRAYQMALGAAPKVVFRKGKPSSSRTNLTELFEIISTRFMDSFKLLD